MTLEEIIESLDKIENELRSSRVRLFFLNQTDDEIVDEYIMLRADATSLIGKLRFIQLIKIKTKLDQLKPRLEAGIVDMQNQIKTLDDAINFLNVLSRIVGLVARVLPV